MHGICQPLFLFFGGASFGSEEKDDKPALDRGKIV